MKSLTYAVVLLVFVGISIFGCAEKSQAPVAPTSQAAQEPASLAKSRIVEFTLSTYPIWFDTNPDNIKRVGGKIHMKNVAVWDTVFSSDLRVAGRMEHHLSATFNIVTGEGPCHGSWTLIPRADVGGGLWEGTYEGYRSETSDPFVFTLPLKLEGHGRGGTIDGMQSFIKADLIVYTNATYYPVPIFWMGTGTGFIKEH